MPSTAAARDSIPGKLREKAAAMEGSPTASVSLDVVVLAALSDLSRQFSFLRVLVSFLG